VRLSKDSGQTEEADDGPAHERRKRGERSRQRQRAKRSERGSPAPAGGTRTQEAASPSYQVDWSPCEFEYEDEDV
jgi:hypothetical protein